mmetsp:Transcript_21495/g.29236  ORF Transcript_21495/g.29236 Transcript_21495/m.29236 type:complete len:136 (+) Transcript_21495:1264-1671(+)
MEDAETGETSECSIRLHIYFVPKALFKPVYEELIFENERWSMLTGWSAEALNYDEKKFCSSDGTKQSEKFCDVVRDVLPGHQVVNGEGWHLVQSDFTDIDSWKYAYDWVSSEWYSLHTTTSFVRRRVWCRELARI